VNKKDGTELRRNRAATLALVLTLVSMGWLYRVTPAQAQVDLKVHPAPDFGAGGVWLDQGQPAAHHISDYRGQVVLVDFWEFTCINCIRDFAVVKRWYGKYHAYGLDVIGVHYGEFAIGFNVDNVRAAAQQFKLPWPVVADQKGSTWKAYASDGWPNRYLIDASGNIVMKVFGESNNRELEVKIRELLAVAHPEVLKVEPGPEENELKPSCGVPTQETFVGEIYGRSAIEDMPGHYIGDAAEFQPPHSPPDGGVMLVGRWRVEQDGVVSDGRSAGAEVRYHARSLYAVLSIEEKRPVRVNLFQDGMPMPKEGAGADVLFDGKGAHLNVTESRMYYLVRSPVFTAHLISLQPESAGLGLHSFTYGNNCQLEDRP
jgi:thiol-disulfide isomerase/thioredoxin